VKEENAKGFIFMLLKQIKVDKTNTDPTLSGIDTLNVSNLAIYNGNEIVVMNFTLNFSIT
jgi:hypothetical protein